MADLPGIRYGAGSLGRVIAIRLAPGADLLRSIRDVAKAEGIRAGVIVSGVASLSRATLRNVLRKPEPFPITDAHRIYTPKEETLELLSLSGNIAERDGEIVVHGHFVVSSGVEKGVAYGGHLIEGCQVLSTGEVVIVEILGLPVVRRVDPETRAAELYFTAD